jgi:hypothetical protein
MLIFLDVFAKGRITSIYAFQKSPLVTRRSDDQRFPGEELVVLLPMLPHRLTQGYSNVLAQTVTAVNGTPIRNLDHLVEKLRDSNDRFLVFDFAENRAESLVFEREKVLAVSAEILDDNGIRQQASNDLLRIWRRRE